MIKQISINGILGMDFYIPAYQRGYRWSRQQVSDLLNDIYEASIKRPKEIYCIQPLVVKKREQQILDLIKEAKSVKEVEQLLEGNWEVVDGQQRLTTIYIILKCLEVKNLYELNYETREDCKTFLLNFKSNKELNIDYYHILEAKKQAECWLDCVDKQQFVDFVLSNVQFIWYEINEEDPTVVFKRLNLGKIPLTNSELIKAMLLNSSNFNFESNDLIKIRQFEIASNWNKIENNLQDENFWLFLNQPDQNYQTRIDFIFNMIYENNKFEIDDNKYKIIGDDKYKVFRYFSILNDAKKMLSVWALVMDYFKILQEWYDDLIIYHYIGYLLEVHKDNRKNKLNQYIDKWQEATMTKDEFCNNYLLNEIQNAIIHCCDLDKLYEISGSPKTQSRPLLLLFNIQSIIDQNLRYKSADKYQLMMHYKFPFHLFKKEKWDVEHIDSTTQNNLSKTKDKIDWLKASYIGVFDEQLRKEIQSFIENKDIKDEDSVFSQLQQKIMTTTFTKSLDSNEKNMIWNFTLLDASTNRSYGNSIFAAKRRVIIAKSQGCKISLNDSLEEVESDNHNELVPFIPPSTLNVFMKSYTKSANNVRQWDKIDSQEYLEQIKKTLSKFLTPTIL